MSGLILSYSGKTVSPLDLKPEQVVFEDIPHTLAQKVRFNGHLQQMGYSVAQHCVIGAEEIGRPLRMHSTFSKEELELKLAFLLHEVSEVYLPDVPAPIKPFLGIWAKENISNMISWDELEENHAVVVFEALRLSDIGEQIYSEEVKRMDRRMLVTEKRDLRLHGEFDERIVDQERWQTEYPPLDHKIDRVWTAERAKADFTEMYYWLRKELGR